MRIFRFEEIDSTNSFFKRMENIKNFDLAIAQIQTAGRGRRGNSWKSQTGAGLFTFILEDIPNREIGESVKIPLVMGLALLKGVKYFREIKFDERLDFAFKWTNDLYLNEKKLAGILVEKKDNFIIVGIGININNENLEELSHRATSLIKETGNKIEIEDLIMNIVVSIKQEFRRFSENRWPEILQEINEYNFLKGKNIKVEDGERNFRGLAGEINFDGTLTLLDTNGERQYLSVGEVHLSEIK